MGVIESEEAARRLARVIVSDIEIYNREKFQAGADLTAAIEEGRALFRSRVAPEFLPVFTSVLEDRRGASRKGADARPAVATPAQPAPQAAPRPTKPAEPTPRAVVAAVPAPAPVPVAAPPEPIASIVAAPAVPDPAPAEIAAAPAPIPPTLAAPTPAPEPAPAVAAPSSAPAKPAPTGVTRAGLIETEEAAARLARVIISDIQLYNAKKIASGADLTTEIEEGRHLFKTRVSADLLPVFESTLASKGIGQRKRAASPVPVPPKAKPVIVAEPPMAASAPTPRPVMPTPAPVPAVAARPSISAAKAPPAAQPRPGVTVTRRPTPAPLSVPMAMAEVGSGRHHAPGLHSPPPGRAAPPPIDASPEDEALTPGAMAGMAIGITPPPSELAHPSAARAITSRPPPTPPAVPHQPRITGPQARVPTPVPHSPPPRRERPPSLPEMAIAVDSGPLHLDPAHAALPPQEVLDALPAAAPLPPLPVTGGFAHQVHPPAPAHPPEHHAAPPMSLPAAPPVVTPALAAPPRLPTPPTLPQAPFGLAIAPPPSEDEVISLRRGISKTRLLLTIVALGGAGSAIWYFLLR